VPERGLRRHPPPASPSPTTHWREPLPDGLTLLSSRSRRCTYDRESSEIPRQLRRLVRLPGMPARGHPGCTFAPSVVDHAGGAARPSNHETLRKIARRTRGVEKRGEFAVGAGVDAHRLVRRTSSVQCAWPDRSFSRVSVAIQFTSQVLPPSSEKACSKRHESGVMPEMTNRT
jgi:hypothetical protein